MSDEEVKAMQAAIARLKKALFEIETKTMSSGEPAQLLCEVNLMCRKALR